MATARRPRADLPGVKPKPPPGSPAVERKAPASVVMEFRRLDSREQIRIERWEALRAEFADLEKEALPDWDAVMRRHPRTFLIVRRLFGVVPVLLPLSGDPEDYRTRSRAEVMEELGITEAQLRAELDEARRQWKNTLPGAELCTGPNPSSTLAPASAPEIQLSDDEVLVAHGFPADRMFRSEPDQKQRFVARVREWSALLKHKLVQTTARTALLLEMRIARIELALATEDPTATGDEERKRYRDLASELAKLADQHSEAIGRIDEMAPWFNVTGQTLSFKNAVSELVAGIQEYQSSGSTAKVDGIFTAAEIQVLLRTSVQRSEPQYRLGWVTAVNASREFLFDPNGRSKFKHSHLAKLDAGFKEGVRRLVETSGESVPDLERDGPEGEYPDIFVPQGEGLPEPNKESA